MDRTECNRVLRDALRVAPRVGILGLKCPTSERTVSTNASFRPAYRMVELPRHNKRGNEERQREHVDCENLGNQEPDKSQRKLRRTKANMRRKGWIPGPIMKAMAVAVQEEVARDRRPGDGEHRNQQAWEVRHRSTV